MLHHLFNHTRACAHTRILTYPWTPLGAQPPDPHISSRSRARHEVGAPPYKNPRSALDDNNDLHQYQAVSLVLMILHIVLDNIEVQTRLVK